MVAKLVMNLTSEDTALCVVRFLGTSGDSANKHHATLDSTSDLTHPGPRGGGRGLHGAYLGDAVGFGGGAVRVSTSVFDGECCGF